MSDLELIPTNALLAELARRSDAIYVAFIPKAMSPGDGPREFTYFNDAARRLSLLGMIGIGHTALSLEIRMSTTPRPLEEEGDPG